MKGHIDAPVDIRTHMIKLIAERIAVGLFKAKAIPVEERYRLLLAEFLLNEFDITEKEHPLNRSAEAALQLEIKRAAMASDRLQKTTEKLAEIPVGEAEDLCLVCLGKTWICFTCRLPEGSCTHVGYRTDGHLIVCPACDGTGKAI